MKECEVKENCKTYDQGKCWICEDYSLYNPINKHVLCKRQIREREERRIQKQLKKQSEASKRGKRAKRKGYAGENEVVKLLEKYNIKAERIPLSGALKSEKYSCDVVVTLGNKTKRIEVKRRKSGLKTLQKWLNEDKHSNYVFFREDFGDWLVVMPLHEWIELVGGVEDGQNSNS